jgi:TRAP-type C4-dicarboxylate transport system permease small subunit
MTFRARLDQILGFVLIALLSIMVVNVIWQVFSRYILGDPSSFTDELARYLMIWLGVLGAAYVSGKNQHVAIDVLQQKLSYSKQKALKKFVYFVIILFAFFALFIGGLRLVYITYVLGQSSPGLQIPLAYIYVIIPISGALIVYYKISDFLSVK